MTKMVQLVLNMIFESWFKGNHLGIQNPPVYIISVLPDELCFPNPNPITTLYQSYINPISKLKKYRLCIGFE